MKRFSFRLERLLQLRESAEQERARELGVALRDEAERRANATAGEQRLAEARTQMAVTSQGRAQAGTLQNLELAIGALARESQALAEQHERSLERLEIERREFEEARMAKRVLERLREQRHEAWNDSYNRWEQAQMDETAGQRAHGQGEL